MNMNSKKMMIVSAFTLSLAMAASANAMVGKVESSELVNFSDLDLKKTEAQATLQKRVEASAARVCGVDESKRTGSVKQRFESNSCYRSSVKAAMEKVVVVGR